MDQLRTRSLTNRLSRLAAAFFLSAYVAVALAHGDDAIRVQQLEKAAKFAQQQNFDAAAEIIETLLKNSPNDAVALNLLGVVRVQQGRRNDAEQLFRQALQAGHGIIGPHLNLARLYGEDHPLESLAELKEALQLKPGDPAIVALLHSLSKQACLSAMRAGDHQRALAIASAARNANPHDAELLYELGLIESDSGVKHEAQKSLEEALRERPDFYEARYALARVYLDENLAKQAEALMRQCIETRPTDATAQYGLGYVLLAEQQLGEAKRAFEKSLSLQPEQTESRFQLGSIAQQEGNAVAAKAAYEAVLLHDPQHAGALTGLAVLEFQAADFEKAERNLRQAVKSAPAYQKAHYYYALTLGKLGRKQQAEQEFAISRSLQKSHTVESQLAVSQ